MIIFFSHRFPFPNLALSYLAFASFFIDLQIDDSLFSFCLLFLDMDNFRFGDLGISLQPVSVSRAWFQPRRTGVCMYKIQSWISYFPESKIIFNSNLICWIWFDEYNRPFFIYIYILLSFRSILDEFLFVGEEKM